MLSQKNLSKPKIGTHSIELKNNFCMKRILTVVLLFISVFINAQVIKPVKWKFSLEPLSGNEYNLVFEAIIDEPWHMYDTNVPDGGPIATSFNYADKKNYKLIGKLQELSTKTVKFDPTFNMKIGMFSDKAIFKQKISQTSEKPFELKGYVEFMVCNNNTCLAPEEYDFSFKIPAAKQIGKEVQKKTASQPDSSKVITTQVVSDTLKTAQTATVIQKSDKQKSTITEKKEPEKEESLWMLFFGSLLQGFIGVVTPCVYPMVPMTVSFFMRGQEKRKKSIFSALFFGLSIILIYTSLGGIVSLTGASSNLFQVISSHWIPNVIFFLLFLTFAISFFGLFEIVLPSRFTNKMDQQADKGGFLAPFFMAVTLVLVSFSCTGPLVTSLLIEASKGAVIRPTIGMLGYSLAFALPFTLFAIFPELMKSLPKSGGWLNSVKIFFAFLLLAWGMKFLANIDLSYHLNVFTREAYIGIWVVLFTLLGLYLLGKIKFAHDSEMKHVGIFRLFIIITVFSFVLYLIPGIFGAPLTTISGWLPPKTKQVFDLTAGTSSVTENSSSICGKAKYSDFLAIPYGIEGYFDYEEGLACAKKQNKPLLIDFNGFSCTNCKVMENEVWPDKRVMDMLKTKFVIVSLYIDDHTKLPEKEQYISAAGKTINTLGKKNMDFQLTKFNSNAQPFYVIMDNSGNIINKPFGFTRNADEFFSFLQKGVADFKKKQ
jgi:thiol:disulfide interchange protein DsbD